jgi:glycosyltransferase involved in cell wall biosynthesis
VLVVPCYNEAERLPASDFASFAAANRWLTLILVDDGSSDDTLQVLQRLADDVGPRCRVLARQPNAGKAEAVRAGMLEAFALRPRFAGYWDADLATPLQELPRFREQLLAQPQIDIVLGSRVRLLGHDIDRRVARHYLGRVFATVASVTLRLPVYDTQCGAKLFRANDEMQALFAEPFCTGWVFDVEILARLIRDVGPAAAERKLSELPLNRWVDVAGSRVKAIDFARAIGELNRIRRRYLSRAQ